MWAWGLYCPSVSPGFQLWSLPFSFQHFFPGSPYSGFILIGFLDRSFFCFSRKSCLATSTVYGTSITLLLKTIETVSLLSQKEKKNVYVLRHGIEILTNQYSSAQCRCQKTPCTPGSFSLTLFSLSFSNFPLPRYFPPLFVFVYKCMLLLIMNISWIELFV
jgi:hypothetical protein